MAAKTARDIMTPECECVGEDDTVLDAAKQLAELDVGAMPICGSDDRFKGMITDRDTNIDEEKVGDLVEAISAAPSDTVRSQPRLVVRRRGLVARS